MEGIDIKDFYSILHLLGVVIGAGSAFMSHAVFFACVKDRRIEKTELKFVKLGSSMTWVGVVVILVSGALLFSLDPVQYIGSSKFLLKMTIVLILLVNGALFHRIHVPIMERSKGRHLAKDLVFVKNSAFLLASGTISLVSWVSALVLGGLRTIPVGYLEGLGLYFMAVAIAIIWSLFFRRGILFD